MGQFSPANCTTSPRLLTMSLPRVLKGPYGHDDCPEGTVCRGCGRLAATTPRRTPGKRGVSMPCAAALAARATTRESFIFRAVVMELNEWERERHYSTLLSCPFPARRRSYMASILPRDRICP